MNDPETPLNVEEAKKHLTELVLEYFSIPRPYRTKYLRELEEELLPMFILMARHSWSAATTEGVLRGRAQSDDPSYNFLASNAEQGSERVRQLDYILEEIGINDFLRDLAVSPYVAVLSSIPVDPYEERLLKATAHPKPETVVPELLQRIAKDPSLIASPSDKLERAAQVLLRVRKQFNEEMSSLTPISDKLNRDTAKPKRLKLFNGLGSLCSGLVLLAGDGVFIPTVITTGGLTAIPLIASVAGGIAAVGKGAGDLFREGE